MRYFIEINTQQYGFLFYGANTKEHMEALVDEFNCLLPKSIVVTELGKEILRIEHIDPLDNEMT